MSVATAHTVSLHGAVGHLVDVQADVSPGAVATVLLGRPDASLHEARDRCRTAVTNAGLVWPATRRTTILLSPADLPKQGTHFDLAMACAVLAATGAVPAQGLERLVLIGELTLAGQLRGVSGVLPMVLSAVSAGFGRVVVPEPQAYEAAMVPGVEVLGLRSLAQVVAELRGQPVPEAAPVAPSSGTRLLSWRGAERRDEVDLADLVGMAEARYAVEVAAAGGHHLLLSGPKGTGKTSIAERIPGILPDLTPAEAVELTAVHSLAGALEPGDGLLRRPPFSAPHHDASTASIVGGGQGQVRPGEISRAHCGVLFLDEFPLFRSDVIDALREPLENGDITITRAEESAVLPARGIVVLACNPCPCGMWTAAVDGNGCACTETARRHYRRRLSAPVLDRVDVTRHLRVGGSTSPDVDTGPPESSLLVRRRVQAARDRQAERWDGCGWRLNGHAPGAVLLAQWPLPPEGRALVDEQLARGRLTRRGCVRVHRLALTVADLAGRARPTAADVATALALRTGDDLASLVVSRRAG